MGGGYVLRRYRLPLWPLGYPFTWPPTCPTLQVANIYSILDCVPQVDSLVLQLKKTQGHLGVGGGVGVLGNKDTLVWGEGRGS